MVTSKLTIRNCYYFLSLITILHGFEEKKVCILTQCFRQWLSNFEKESIAETRNLKKDYKLSDHFWILHSKEKKL